MPNSLTPRYLRSLAFGARHLEALARLGEHRGREGLFVAQRPDELEHLRQAAIVASTVSSNRIEGVEVAQSRLGELMSPSPRPRDRGEGEVAGYRAALELIHDAHEHMPARASTLLQLHKLLYRYHPADGSRYKSQDNAIVETGAGGEVRVRFRPTSAVATPGEVERMFALYSPALASHEALVVAPLLVLDFLCVHPFGDGNGRVSRLLTLLELYRAGHSVGRFVSLERVIERTKAGYYEALEASSRGWHDGAHDAVPWLEYFWGALLGAYAEFEERVAELVDSGRTKADSVELVALSMAGPFKVADITERLPHVSRPTISRALAGMRRRGLLELTGRGAGATWRVVPQGR